MASHRYMSTGGQLLMLKGEFAGTVQKTKFTIQRLTSVHDQRGTRRPSGKVKKKKARHR